MASIHRDPKSGTYRLMFRYGGKQYQKSLKTTDAGEADRLMKAVETVLLELDRGRKTLPEGADLWEFLKSDGKRAQKAEVPTTVSLETLFDRYEHEMPPGTMEDNSLDTIRIHTKHLLRILGRRTAAQSVSSTTMQGYINRRAKESYRKKPISPRTIRKEVFTFRSVWNWGKVHGLVTGDAPTAGLKYEKEDEKPGFMTWEEIERRVERGGLTGAAADALWESLFLSREQVAGCLEHVRKKADHAFVYPMFVFVAHTGARRSELVRSQVEDIDFAANRVRIREKKRVRTKKETSRYVEMTPLLKEVMREWLGRHPGGPYTFCQTEVVSRSRTRSRTTGHQSGPGRAKTEKGRAATVRERVDRPGHVPLTKDEATHHFKKALAGSKWAVVRGFHVFRHSFASNLALAGARQEVIDAMLGHQTEEMRKRYRHLYPQETQDAMRKVFGG